jgi:pimeloyl-ACP methyl ester carboxylesterase
MNHICNLPSFEIEMDKQGSLARPCQLQAILEFLAAQGGKTRDLFVMSHGWNNDMEDARSLYRRFFTQVCATLDKYATADLHANECAVIGVLWPSEKFADPELIAGGAAGFGDGARQLLRLTTYRLMKHRAGVVGRNGAARMLDQIEAAFPSIRVHLIGHSFGCRLATSAAAVIRNPVTTMTLLQAAFSHNSFSPGFDSTQLPGAFRNVVSERKVAGPILISHSRHDLAVGLAYPCASRLFRQNASAIGDAGDLYGALGRNGARHTPEAVDIRMLEAGSKYALAAGRIFNLDADEVISGHSDIVKFETAWAVINAAMFGRGV